MSYIQLIKGENKKNLDILISFYNNVWGNYAEYVENDKILYEIFQNKQQHLHITTLIVIDVYYATQSFRFQRGNFRELHSNIVENKYNFDGEAGSQSLASKYYHWCNEVDKKASPIYDKNVRNALNFYINENVTKNCSVFGDYNSLQIAIDTFITKYLGCNVETPIPVTVEGLPTQISIYRLVDKFLWLSYKIKHQSVPINVQEAYNNLTNKK